MGRKINRVGKDVENAISQVNQVEQAPSQVTNEAPQQENAVEEIKHYPVAKTYLEKQQAMKKFGLVSPKKGSRIDIDQDLHDRLKICAIKLQKTQKEWLEEIIEDAVLKAEKNLEKTI